MRTLIATVACLSLAALAGGGCAHAQAPVNGFLYSKVDGPLSVTMSATAAKKGVATCTSILGLVADGDASIEAAMKEGGITRIHHVDHESYSILGFYAKFTTIVWGDSPTRPEGVGGAGTSEPGSSPSGSSGSSGSSGAMPGSTPPGSSTTPRDR